MNDLDERLIDYYQSESMNSSRLQSILSQTRKNRQRRLIPLYAAAAMVMMLSVSVLHHMALVSERTSLALREAAMNHATKLQLDVETPALASLQSSLTKLPFELKLPTSGIYETLELIGGRYCTINGNLAAHLKFREPGTNQYYSLFLTPFAQNLKSIKSDEVDVSGIQVKLWREEDVVYALAKTSI